MFDLYHQANRQIRKLHNQLRVNPQSFLPAVSERLGSFQQNVYFSKDLPGLGIVTHEGVQAVRDLINYLQTLTPVHELSPSLALQVAAYRHCQDLANNSHLLEHTGSDGTNAEQRLSCYGRWEGHLIEQIIFGFKDPYQILVNMLVDDGLGSRANRRNMTNKGLRHLGIGICPHPLYGYVCVIMYAKIVEDYSQVLMNDHVAQILL